MEDSTASTASTASPASTALLYNVYVACYHGGCYDSMLHIICIVRLCNSFTQLTQMVILQSVIVNKYQIKVDVDAFIGCFNIVGRYHTQLNKQLINWPRVIDGQSHR